MARLSGNIFSHRKFRYNRSLTNLLVTNFMIATHGDYRADYDMGAQETRYAWTDMHGKPHKPFIHVFDQPMDLFDYNPDIEWPDENSLFFAHIENSERDAARTIYNTTNGIYRSLKQKLPKTEGLGYVFDDEKRLFLPAEFRRLVSAA